MNWRTGLGLGLQIRGLDRGLRLMIRIGDWLEFGIEDWGLGLNIVIWIEDWDLGLEFGIGV